MENDLKDLLKYTFMGVVLLGGILYLNGICVRYLIKGTKQQEIYSKSYSKALEYAMGDDNVLTFEEQVKLWNVMGFKGPFIESDGSKTFPIPNLSQIEKAIANYEATKAEAEFNN